MDNFLKFLQQQVNRYRTVKEQNIMHMRSSVQRWQPENFQRDQAKKDRHVSKDNKLIIERKKSGKYT